MSEPAAGARVGSGAVAATLTARPALGVRASAVEVRELTDRSLVTIVLPPAPTKRGEGTTGGVPDGAGDGGEPVRRRLERAFGVTLPAVGDSVLTDRDERLLGLQSDRLYVLFDADEAVAADPERALRERLGTMGSASPTDAASTGSADGGDHPDGRASTLYLNDQSDSWVMLRVAGAGVRRALERLCPLDLHPDAFAPGAVARTVMEHLAVIVLHEAEDTFVLLSPRSSAASFLHEIETSVRWTRDLA